MTLEYRGLALDQLDILHEVLDGCNKGDFNHDGLSNLLDIVSMINYIVEGYYLTEFQECTSDMNEDLNINILDVIILLIDNFTENINFNNIKLIFINAVNILLIHFIGNILKIMKFYE